MSFPSGVGRTIARRLTAALGVAALLLPAQPALAAERAAPDECGFSTLGRTGLRAADPSVIRVGGTYIAAQAGGGGIQVRQASSPDGLAAAPARLVWRDAADLGSVWAPEIVRDGGRYYIYFTAGNDSAHRMYAISSTSPTPATPPRSSSPCRVTGGRSTACP